MIEKILREAATTHGLPDADIEIYGDNFHVYCEELFCTLASFACADGYEMYFTIFVDHRPNYQSFKVKREVIELAIHYIFSQISRANVDHSSPDLMEERITLLNEMKR